ncbi:MAG: recombinase RecT [Aeromonas popoffii]|uniref:recombinase RecT n=1 Tax=Aeromonas popoffii TaxID=70856 RepID=UPI003F2F7006
MSNALSIIAASNGVTQEEVAEVLRGMIISGKGQHGAQATNAEMTVVSSIFAKYDLNPFIREGHAFVSGGKLQVMIGLDGWIKIANRHPEFDGYEQFDNFDDKGELVSVTTKIYVKNRRFPTPHTEYMKEAFVPTSPAWKKYSFRMLAGKSLGQCVRKAFGISEVLDDDEASRITANSSHGTREKDITPAAKAIDWEAIEADMTECGDEASLNAVCIELRSRLEADGQWAKAKDTCILMKSEHRERIQAYSQQQPEPLEGELMTEIDTKAAGAEPCEMEFE